MQSQYGHMWSGHGRAIDEEGNLTEVGRMWSTALERRGPSLDQIAFGIQESAIVYPDRPPTLGQFINLCRPQKRDYDHEPPPPAPAAALPAPEGHTPHGALVASALGKIDGLVDDPSVPEKKTALSEHFVTHRKVSPRVRREIVKARKLLGHPGGLLTSEEIQALWLHLKSSRIAV